MRDSGRIAAAIEILTQFEERRLPVTDIIAAWGRLNRFAGSGDRAWISGLVLDTLRTRRSIAWRMESEDARAAVLGTLRFTWDWSVEQIATAAAEEPHGPGQLTQAEKASLENGRPLEESPDAIGADVPDWIMPLLARISDNPVAEGQAFGARAPIDIRVNLLKADREKAAKALAHTAAGTTDLVENALRVPAPTPHAKAPALGALPAFGKGFVEVQDLGSQIAALAAGNIAGAQVLDLCAGAGGKTLALGALAGNTGQIFAWDADGRRLKPIFDRLRRAGARNVQVRSPLDGATLDDLADKMDVVFVDAPCSGSGTWRRKPDTKWRLSEAQLQRRMAEQDAVLGEAARYVKPGGRLVYVTCSLFAEENEDRLSAFLHDHPDFSLADPVGQMAATGLLAEGAGERLSTLRGESIGLRLTPHRTGTDGFFVAALNRR